MTAATSHSELLAAVLTYAKRGWPVFPCQPHGKRPLTAHGLKDASTDAEVIGAWWEQWPDVNVAVVTGKESRLFVLDVDGDDGMESLRAFERDHGALPKTTSVVTPSGGQHFYFRYPAGREIRNSAGKLGVGLDTRAEGGYVLVPPSVGVNGRRYEPDERAGVAPVPELLTVTVSRNGNGSEPDTPIPAGQRNHALASLAGSMRRRGMSVQAMTAALKTENRARCQPHWTTAKSNGSRSQSAATNPSRAPSRAAKPRKS